MKPQLHPSGTPVTQESVRAWSECDFFCIAGYAGVTRRCGWRGRLHEAAWDDVRRLRTCPRCGGATLLGVPNGAAAGSAECPA